MDQVSPQGDKMTGNQRKTVIGIVIAVVFVLLLVFAGYSKNPGTVNQNENNATSTGSMASSTASSTQQKAEVKTQKPIDLALTYQKIVEQYGDRRIQFDNACQAFPARLGFKNGTAIMLDNRTEKTKTIKLSGRAFILKPLGYITMKVTSKILPSTVFIDCDSHYNVGQIFLQE